jgi:hypothetical protein
VSKYVIDAWRRRVFAKLASEMKAVARKLQLIIDDLDVRWLEVTMNDALAVKIGRSDFSGPCLIGFDSSSSRCGPLRENWGGRAGDPPVPEQPVSKKNLFNLL